MADNATLGVHSITGYSGGGKGMIAEYQEMGPLLQSPRPYALGLAHKHIPEIQFYTGLKTKPVFLPVVGSFYQGLTASIPLHSQNLSNNQSARDVHQVLVDYYQDEPFINVLPFDESSGTIDGYLNVLRVYIDKSGGVSMADCSNISRQLGDIIDVSVTIGAEYRLEVSSPGIYRQLYKKDDYVKFCGRAIKIQTDILVDGKKKLSGTLESISDDGIVEISVDGSLLKLDYSSITKAQLTEDNGDGRC